MEEKEGQASPAEAIASQAVASLTKEKAEEYAYTNWESDEYHDGDEFDPIGHTQKAFEEGVNYVLSVLFDASYKEDWISNPKEGIRRFFEIYKELKKVKL